MFQLCKNSQGLLWWDGWDLVVKHCPGYYCLCYYTCVYTSGFGVIISIGANFWVCYFWLGIFFLGFCFLSGLQADMAYG